MKCGIISLFPEMFQAMHFGITGRALEEDLINLMFYNPRDFTEDKHRTVDDRPYGGGPGMVLLAEPIAKAIRLAKKDLGEHTKVLYLSPQGRRLEQTAIDELASRQTMILLAGRYEGIDERVLDLEVDEHWSIGDYVLSGGELPAMVLLDTIIRQLPGALGHEQSAAQDSFATGLLDCPHYTRPEVYRGKSVPTVLLSGNHDAIRRWRLKEALGKTWLWRRDLLEQYALSAEEKKLLDEFIAERKGANNEYDH